MPRLPHQGMNQTGNFPVNQVVTGQRMPFASQGQNQQANQMGGNQMIVNQSGPSPGGSMVVPSSGLSPFGCANSNSSGMTPPNSSAPAVVAQQNAQQMLSNRPIMSPSNDFNPNIIHVVNNQKQQQQQNSMNSQAPSPFNQSQNVFNNNLMMQNSNNNNNHQRMMQPPTPGDLIPVPSPSPSLNSNGQPPSVSTPNTPNIVASLFNRPEPTPPPSMPIPSPSHAGAGKGQNFGGMNNNSMNAGMLNNNNNNSSNNRSSLSSQRAALEAACKEEDSPPTTVHSPQNNNRGKLDQKLDSKMEMDDDKSDMGDIKIKTEDLDDHKMGSKSWIEAVDVKKEKNDGEDMKGREGSSSGGGWDELKDIKREIKMEIDDDKRKIKEEAMSPASTSDSQALVKTEMKLEPVANTTDKKKKCSKYTLSSYKVFFITILFCLFSI